MTTEQGPNVGYLEFDRDHWAALRAGEPMSLAPSEMETLTSPTQPMAPEEVRQILLPLSRLLHLHAAQVQSLKVPQTGFKAPYVIGVSGSVAVGKSSFARVLAALLAYWPGKPNVHLVTTDSFLYPLATLQEKNILHRKGFPESYDEPLFVDFLQAVCRRGEAARIPIYSHVRYDILADEAQSVEAPDIIILEGLNVLQGERGQGLNALDFIDFSIYVDAPQATIKTWYLERFVYLKNTAFQSADSYFNKYKGLSDTEALSVASDTWDRVNLKNLVENILPTRERANLIIHKSADHSIDRLLLRQA
ncbi:type I pantothenate kinase [Pseudomonas sp. Au-Pse12]|uniref:type I pantothenate kinase n=1 Tax=Pseudomonas sp. Au-Pse12 TaxID=2906459 RepID=UPI002277F63C|nr:type I pantothenate kinase [Pseudomonas sp. Au-Pse12]